MKSEPELVRVSQAARLVGRSPLTARRWVWRGELSSGSRGRLHLISRSELEAVALARGRRLPQSLAGWAKQTRAALEGTGTERLPSAQDLVLEDRARQG